MVRLLYISIWTRCWCFWLSRQLLVSTPPGFFSSLPAMLPCMTLTRLSFHNLESPTSSTTERETILHGVILSVCWCAQLPLRFAAFVLLFSWKNIGIIHLKLILCHVSCHPDVFFSTHTIRTGYSYQSMFFFWYLNVYIYIYIYVYCIYALFSNLYNHGDSASPPTKGICCDLENTAGADRREAAIQSTRTGVVEKKRFSRSGRSFL